METTLKIGTGSSVGRVLMLATAFGFTGGAEAQVARLALKMKARNWDVCIVSLTEIGERVKELEQEEIAVRSLQMRPRIPDVRAIFRLRSMIQEFRPDVVHCHMYHANILGRITRLFCRMPALVCTAHNVRETSVRGGPTWHKEILYRLTDPLADQTTIICKAGFERYRNVGAVPSAKLRFIPNGIDTEVFAPDQARRELTRSSLGITNQFVWLAAGRLVVQKDYPTLIHAVEQLGQRDDFVLLIAGDGPLDSKLRDYCGENGLGDVVRFCGASDSISSLYDAADAFVMSSEWEGLPMALLEASAMRLPSVVTDVGGNAEIVIDGVTGYIVPAKEPRELASAMFRLMQAPPQIRRRMSQMARKYCRERYGMDAVVDKWLALYVECLRGNREYPVASRRVA